MKHIDCFEMTIKNRLKYSEVRAAWGDWIIVIHYGRHPRTKTGFSICSDPDAFPNPPSQAYGRPDAVFAVDLSP